MRDDEAGSNVRGKSQIARGSAASVAAQVLYLTTRFLLTPFVIAHAGLEAYGFWSLLFVILGGLGVHRMGLAGPASAFVARYVAEGRRDRVDATLVAAATVALGWALVVGTALVVAAPAIASALGTSAELRPAAILAFRLTTLATFASLVLGGYQSALEGLQEYPRVRLVDALACLLEAVAIVVLLDLGAGLVGLAVAYALRLLAPIPAFAVLARRRLPALRALPGRSDRETLRRVAGFGGSMQLLGVLHLAIASVDRLVLANLVSLGSAGGYEVARKLVSFAAALPAQGLGPLGPAAAERRARETKEPFALSGLVRSATRIVSIAGAAPLAFLVAASPSVVRVWVGPGHDDVAACVRLLALSGFVHLSTGPATAVLRGLAAPGCELAYALAWLLSGLVLMPLGALHAGLLGVAAGSALAQAGASVLLLALALPRLGVRRGQLARDVLLPAMLAAAPASVVALGAAALASGSRLAVSVRLLVAAVAVGGVAWSLSYRLVLEKCERAAFASGLEGALCRLRLMQVRPAAEEVVA